MKNMRKLVCLLLAMVMVLGLAVTASAAGDDGKITIKQTTNVSVAGKTFNAYKILDLTTSTSTVDGKEVTNYAYTVPSELTQFYQDWVKPENAGEDYQAPTEVALNQAVYDKLSEMQNNSDELFKFAAAALAAAKAATITPSTATAQADATSVTITAPLGYYVVEDTGTATPISALILDTVGNVDVNIKADKPSADKKIVEGNQKVVSNNGAIGDTVNYEVTSRVPDMTGYEKYYFVVNDTLSKGLTFKNDVAITIKGAGENGADKVLTNNTDYTVTTTTNSTTGATEIEIVFKNFIQYKAMSGKDIVITYSATINSNAVVGVEGNPNEVKLVYSNNPNTTDKGDPNNPDKPTESSPVGETPKSETRTYVTEIELIKVDENKNRLTGAEFQISGQKLNTVLVKTEKFEVADDGTYYKLKDGTYTETAPTADTTEKYESTTTKYSKTPETKTIQKTENVKYTATVGADGTLKFTGLAAGDYIITETKAPNGYNLLKDSINLTIGWTAPSGTSTDCSWTYKWNNGEAGSTNSIEVENKSGTELPSTGGMGTTLFYVIGSVLALGAAVLLITKRRMNAR